MAEILLAQNNIRIKAQCPGRIIWLKLVGKCIV